MRKSSSKLLLGTALVATLLSNTALGDDKSGFAIGVHAGTSGLGGQLTYGINDFFAVKLNYQSYTRDIDDEYEGNTYKGDLELESLGLMADWNVFGGGFRVTAGLMDNGNKATANSTSLNGEYELDGEYYDAEAVGTLNALVDFKSTAPYLGIGWGAPSNSDNSLTFTADLGVMFQGTPRVDLSRTGGIESSEIDQAIDNEEAAIEDDIKDAEYWPVLQIGLHYQF